MDTPTTPDLKIEEPKPWTGTLWLEPEDVTRILEMPEPDDKEALDALRSQASLQVSEEQ